MTRQVTAKEAKANLLRLLDDVETGATVEITRHGRVVARLVQEPDFQSLRGSMRGAAFTTDPDDELLSTGEMWSSWPT